MSAPARQAESATPVAAILYILGAGVLFTLLDTSGKVLVLSGMSPQFVAWMRFAEHLVLSLIVLKAWDNRRVFTVSSLPRQILRGLFLFGSTIFNFLALRTLQLGETMSIAFFAPMIITALAGPILGEWAGWRRWLAIGAGFIGVMVIVRPGFSAVGVGHLYALLNVLSYCFYVLMTRKMSTTETSESLIFYSALTPVLLMAPVVPFTASWPSEPVHMVILLCLGVFGGMGHWLLIKAYGLASTTALAPYPYLQMIWMILSGFLVFGQLPDLWTLVGAGIIVASGLYIVQRERRLRLAESSAPGTEDAQLAKKL
ncbi:DMT family transporter [Salmonella enterica subsp. enterica]|nr:EamA/RhaT family transporter [Salmonella enterica subsp. enterica serovar Java]MIL10128.1 DMT family transporter [Salmonella enterica subsp. enterica serovar Enteritidis]